MGEVVVTNGQTPTATDSQLLVVLPFNGVPSPQSRPKPNVYYSFKNKIYALADAMGLSGIFVPLTRSITINGTKKTLDADVSFTVSGGVSDGDKGDITVSDSGATWEINDGSVTNAKIDSIDATKVNEDTTHRFVTDTEKTTWNGKQDALGYTPENVANKQAAVSTDVNHYYNAPYVNSLVLGNRRIVAADFTNVSTVGTTTNEIIMKTLLIPANTYGVGKDPILTSLLTKVAGAPSSTTTLRYRVSTTAIPADITLEPILGVLTASVNTNTLFPFNRYNIHIDTGTSTIVANNSAINDDAVFVNNNSLNIDWTVTQYLHLTLQVSATSTAVYTAHKIIAEI